MIDINKMAIKLTRKEGESIKAVIQLEFEDFTVKGFRILPSNKKPNSMNDMLWLSPPSYLAFGKNHPIFFITNPALWKEIEEKVWAEYYTPSIPKNKTTSELIIEAGDMPL